MRLVIPQSLKSEHEELHSMHAQTEEEVSYSTAILIGEYVKLKLNK